jgi:hypothetical protein
MFQDVLLGMKNCKPGKQRENFIDVVIFEGADF